jgi:hypothetical protein
MFINEAEELTGKLAKIISIVFHPLLMPIYGLLIIFSAPTLYGYLPFEVKKLFFLIVFINNVLLPVSFIPFLKYRNIISSWTIFKREERNIPLILTTILYCSTSYMIFRFPVPVFLKSFIFSAAFLSLVITLINLKWKISIHSAGAGALVAVVFLLTFKMYAPLMWYLISVIFAAGLILSSRLRLDFHDTRQVWYGFLTGLLGVLMFMLVI